MVKNSKMKNMPMKRTSRTAPAAMGGITTKQRSPLPLTAGSGKRMVVQNYEQIATLKNFTTDTWANLQSALIGNPGVVAHFPWLSLIADNYSRFKWKYLRYIYVPNVATSIPGQVYINVASDFADTAPASLADVAVSNTSSIGPAWIGGGINAEKAFRRDLKVDDAVFVDVDVSQFTQPAYYVRKQAGLDVDTKPYVLYYGSSGVANGTTNFGGCGAVYVAYICELFDPVQPALNA
jgi:hypothetical protein